MSTEERQVMLGTGLGPVAKVSVISWTVLCFAGAPGRSQTPSLADVFKDVNPAVVEIHTKETYRVSGSNGSSMHVAGIGSGVLISRDGRVLTAAHLVQTADMIQVVFVTGEKIGAEVMASEPEIDLAYVKLDRLPREPSVATLGDSDRVDVGADVFVIGSPLGLSHTLTVGHISGRHRMDAGGTAGVELFQTDAAVNEGNSGGPLFGMDGKVIGIVSQMLSVSGGSDGLGFAVTSNVAQRFLEQEAFWTGVASHLLSGDLARVFNIPPPGVGLLVQRVAAGSPAERAGLRGGTVRARIGEDDLLVGGDIVLRIMGISVDRPDCLAAVRAKMAAAKRGEKIEIIVLRGGGIFTLTAPAPR